MITHPFKGISERISGAQRRRLALLEELRKLAEHLDLLAEAFADEDERAELASVRSAVVRAHNMVAAAPRIPEVKA